MTLQPKYQAVIKLWQFTSQIHITFARPVDIEVLAEIQSLENYTGFKVRISNDYTTDIFVPPTYDTHDVIIEIQHILKKHQFNNIKVIK